MEYQNNESKNPIAIDHPITDCAHLIDLPPVKNIFDQKVSGNSLNHPKACIKALTVFYPKNGLARLL